MSSCSVLSSVCFLWFSSLNFVCPRHECLCPYGYAVIANIGACHGAMVTLQFALFFLYPLPLSVYLI